MRALWAIARHEGRRAFAALDKRTGFALLAAILLLAASWPLVRSHPLQPERGLYPVAVEGSSPLLGAVRSEPRFRLVEGTPADLQAGRIALLLQPDRIVYDDHSARSTAALQALTLATQRWMEQQFAKEPDQAAAFPVAVNLLPETQEQVAASPASASPSSSSGTTTGGPGNATPPAAAAPSQLALNATAMAQLGLHPSEVNPPFPVRSLLLTFAFLIPMNLVAQLQAGSLLAERTRHRGLLVLSGPVSGATILWGRTLPYVALAVAVVLVAGVLVGAGWLGMLAALPMVLVVVAFATLIGLLARSERELTFLLTGATTMLSTFLFLPAIFVALPPIAFVSPVAVVSAAIEHQAVGWGRFVYATAPLSLATVALGAVAFSLYREETLFSTRGLGQKAMEGLRRLAPNRWAVPAIAAFTVPFALALELFLLAIVIPLGLRAAFPAFLIGVAFVEEALKQLASRAFLSRPGDCPRRWVVGLTSGAGFFVGEKLALLVALVGFGLLPLGTPSLALWGVGGGVLLVAPLLLHATTAAISATGLHRSRGASALSWLAASAVHAAYNALLVVSLK